MPFLDFGDAAHVDVDVLEFADSGARGVGVRVDEAGGDDGVAVVEDQGVRAAQKLDVGAGADGHEAAVLYRKGFGGGVCVAHCVDEAGVRDEVGGGGGRRAGSQDDLLALAAAQQSHSRCTCRGAQELASGDTQ